MLAIREFRFIHHFLCKNAARYNTTDRVVRGLYDKSAEISRSNDDMPITMENPYKEPPKGCILCNVTVDHKNVQLLSQFVSPHTGCIYGRHITGLCGRKQREVSKAIKKAHHMGFMSVTLKDPSFMKDPNICHIKHME
ncbi:28S ribosomal protein S18c, mitochondrial isoform X1 [Brienomyrus brachyistius]|uniref:28S ribosomal protein S18c, mitochondrial isoform X1 n=1 Tax=Brienomyrus brachyistius TaxID=42636 RepID=UPI0020B197A4|nr:28S ribosomal protein S18c, mitochondrial isoform X1 [Brienomyrus brachyistius]